MKKLFAIVMTLAFLSGCGSEKTSTSGSSNINKNGLAFATNIINNDIETSLDGGKSLIKKADAINALGIVKVTTAAAYERAFKSNEIAANEEFYGKKIALTGKISEFSTSLGGSPIVLFGTQGFSFGVSATFDRKYNKFLSGLRKGTTVSIVCEGDHKALSATLDECEFLGDFIANSDGVKKLVKTSIKEEMPSSEIGKAIKAIYIMGKYAPTECASGNLNDLELEKCFKNIDKSAMSEDDKAQWKLLTAKS